MIVWSLIKASWIASENTEDGRETLPSSWSNMEERSSSFGFMGDLETVGAPSISFPDTWLVSYFSGI